MFKASTYKEIKKIVEKYDPNEILFRGSFFLKQITYPRKYRDKKYIFATDFLELAISYIRCANFENKFKIAQAVNKNKITLIELGLKNEIKEMFNCDGYLYIYNKSNFKKSKYSQLKNHEYVSSKAQKPLAIIQVKNVYKIIRKINKIGIINIITKKLIY